MSDIELVGSSSKKKRVVTAPYGKGACNECRKAKARCEGRPECKRCQRLGHVCTRGEDHRKAFTRPLEQALRHKITVLEAKVEALANELAKSKISNVRNTVSAATPNTGPSNVPTSPHNDLSQEPENTEELDAHKERLNRTLQNLHVDDDGMSDPDTDYPDDGKGAESDMDSNDMDGEGNDISSESESEGEERIVERFVSRRRRRTTLFVESDELHEYGLTAVFRLPIHLPARRSASQRRAIRLRRKRDDSPLGRERYFLRLPTPGNPHLDDEALGWKDCTCEDECWRRYIPAEVKLTRGEHDLLLDRLFIFFSSWCMRIIPSRFLRDMYRYLHPPTVQPTTKPSSTTSLPVPVSTPAPTMHVKTPHYSPFLHLALLAVASAFSDDPHIVHPDTRTRLADAAKSHIESECARPSVSAVMALGLLGSYFSGKGEQTVGFVYFGMSARLSQALGLGADCSHWVQTGHIKARDLFDRYWCFHMVCAQDACWSFYVGREFGVPMLMGHGPSHDPHAIAELADPSLDTMAWRMGPEEEEARSRAEEGKVKLEQDGGAGSLGNATGVGGSRSRERREREKESEKMKEKEVDKDAPPCHTFTAFMWSCSLMKKSRQIMTLMNALNSNEGSAIEIKRIVADIDIQLVTWYEDLPPELKLNLKLAKEVAALPHLLMTHLSFRWLLILLHRPFYRRQRGVEVDLSYKRCNVAAREILTILRIWRKLYGSLRFTPITIVQCAFAAGTIYLLAAQQAATGRRPAPEAHTAAVADVEEVVVMLREVALSWECADKVADVFNRLLEAHRRVGQGMALGVGGAVVGTGSSGRKGRFMRKKRGRTRGQVPIGTGEEEMKEGEGSIDPSPVDVDRLVDVTMGGNENGVYCADGQGEQQRHVQNPHHWHDAHLTHASPEAPTNDSSLSPPSLETTGAFDTSLHSDTDQPLSDTNEYAFSGFSAYAHHPLHLNEHSGHHHNHHHNHHHHHHTQHHNHHYAQMQPLHHPSGEDFPMSDEEMWNIFASQLNNAQGGGTGVNTRGMYADWHVAGTELSMDDGTSFADQPFMAFGPSPYVHPVREADLDPPSDVDVDDEALHNLIATMRQDSVHQY